MPVDILDSDKDAHKVESYKPQVFDDEGAFVPPSSDSPGEAFEDGFRAGSETTGDFQEQSVSGNETDELTDFASIKFTRENTLLTNAENYAASIREEAELYVRQLRKEADSLDKQTQSRYEEAEKIHTEAQAVAEKLTADAREQVQQIQDNAYTEGFASGEEAGMNKRFEETAPYLEKLESVLKALEDYRKGLAFYTEKDGVRLAVLIAKKILRQELKINKQAVLKLLAATLAELEGMGTFRVWMNPEDHKFALTARASLERYLGEDQALTLRGKPDLNPGTVLIESDREMIDLSFQSQFHHLESQFGKMLAERESELFTIAEKRPEPVKSAPTQPAEAAQMAPEMPVESSENLQTAAQSDIPDQPIAGSTIDSSQAEAGGETVPITDQGDSSTSSQGASEDQQMTPGDHAAQANAVDQGMEVESETEYLARAQAEMEELTESEAEALAQAQADNLAKMEAMMQEGADPANYPDPGADHPE